MAWAIARPFPSVTFNLSHNLYHFNLYHFQSLPLSSLVHTEKDAMEFVCECRESLLQGVYDCMSSPGHFLALASVTCSCGKLQRRDLRR